jgi:hypothetical protein
MYLRQYKQHNIYAPIRVDYDVPNKKAAITTKKADICSLYKMLYEFYPYIF